MRIHILLAWIILPFAAISLGGNWFLATLVALWLLGFRITEDSLHISDAELYAWLRNA